MDGTRIAYRRWGAHGTPIVLVAGFAEPSWVWHEVAPLLARTHRVYALDLPPFGYSQRTGRYTLPRWTELVARFARQHRLRRPLVVGHSLGAAVAVSLATAHPAAVSGIVLLDGDALPGPGGAGWLTHLLVPPWYTAAWRIATGSDWVFRRGLQSAWGPGRPPFSAPFLAEWKQPFRVQGTAGAFAELLSHGIQGVSVATLRSVRVPRLVVWGAEDGVDSPAAGRRSATLLGTRFVAISDAGHLSMLQQPRAVARAIASVSR